MSGKDYFYLAAAGAVLFLVWQSWRAGGAVVDGLGRFVEGLNFDPASLGQSPQLTEGARLTEADYLRLGYLVRLPDGRTQITPAGEAYIERQRQLAGG